jgi:hypothetical protein
MGKSSLKNQGILPCVLDRFVFLFQLEVQQQQEENLTTLKSLNGARRAHPRDVLAIHGLKVRHPEDINDYKERQIEANSNWAWRLNQRGFFTHVPLVIDAVLMISAVLTCAVSAWFICLWVASAVLMFCKVTVKSAEWKAVPAQTVKGTMPAFARTAWDKAAELYPDSRFTVAELRDTVRNHLLDPILFINLGEGHMAERVAIAVWDENGNEVLPPAS